MDAIQPLLLPAERLDDLIAVLREQGFRVIGPRRRGTSIAYDDVESADDLPFGWQDEQAAGHYRLHEGGASYFDFAVPAHSWKRWLLPPRIRLFNARRQNGRLAVTPPPAPTDKLAFLGVRPCELAAISIQDRVFLEGPYHDADYAARRQGTFLVTVNCGRPAQTCFCASMGTGPASGPGFDLCLTELQAPHRFLLEAGSPEGLLVASALGPLAEAQPGDLAAATALLDGAREQMEAVDVEGVRELLVESRESPHWDEVASRCLGCANCTMVCPTCFCTSVEDTSDLAGEDFARDRVWDSCFSVRYSEMHGLKDGAVRPTGRARYRQWLTHKFSSWQDQFGIPGCVGCGRCVTWCPAKIDVRQELVALRDLRDAPGPAGADATSTAAAGAHHG